MAVVSTCIGKVFEVPINNYINTGKFSFNGYLDEIEDNMLPQVGFNLMSGFSDMFLPPPNKIGGKYIRSSLSLVSANLGAHAFGYPVFHAKYGIQAKHQAKTFLYSIPSIFITNAIFRSCRHVVHSLAIQ